MDDRENALRLRAYQIWERDGRPDGEHESHWRQALKELGIINPAEQPAATAAVTEKPRPVSQPISPESKEDV
jgi:hypothetical protein